MSELPLPTLLGAERRNETHSSLFLGKEGSQSPNRQTSKSDYTRLKLKPRSQRLGFKNKKKMGKKIY